MRIHLVSDLHDDVWRDYSGVSPVEAIPEDLGDVLVVAGDLMECRAYTAEDMVKVFKCLRTKAERVLYVPGNHEYYGFDFGALDLKSLCASVGIDWLGRQEVVIEGQRFIGATLWFDPKSPEVRRHEKNWSDYCIRDLDITIPGEHKKDVDYLRSNVRKGDVVVTHMLPSYESVHPRYAGESTNVFFVVPQDSLIKMAAPKLWLHGHTHEMRDYKLNHTRVVCAPLGIPEGFDFTEQQMLARMTTVVEI